MNSFEWFNLVEQLNLGELAQAKRLSSSTLDDTWQLSLTQPVHYWARSCNKQHQAQLACEADNLQRLREAGLLTAEVVRLGSNAKFAYLITDWHTLGAQAADADSIRQALHKLHQHQETTYGWHQPNHINMLIQHNHWLDNWTSFYRSQRLVPQLNLAKQAGLALVQVNLCHHLLNDRYETDFADYQPVPSLLHGNLWRRAIYTSQAHQQLFWSNPACYYGDAAVDLACLQDIDTQQQTRAMRLTAWYHLYYQLVDFNQQQTQVHQHSIQQTLDYLNQ